MRGLRLYLAPFAPDTSGASSLLFPMRSLTVILDAGGCAGNICAFDEPRWQDVGEKSNRSFVFSAGLRDMDAIMGRDEKLLAKLATAAREVQADFAAIIGTPVPSVIGTDFRSLRRLAEKQIGIPVVTVDTDGTKFYDEGVSKALSALFDTLGNYAATRLVEPDNGTIGLVGATPLDLTVDDLGKIKTELHSKGWRRIICYGTDEGVSGIRAAAGVTKNLALTAAGVQTAEFLQEKFGTPYDIFAPPRLDDILTANHVELSLTWQKILIMHEEITMNGLRRELRQRIPHAEIVCGGWFMRHKEYMEPQDVQFKEEDEWQDYVRRENFACICADKTFGKALPFYEGAWIELPHYAVSGSK